jgi:hypothetical protein
VRRRFRSWGWGSPLFQDQTDDLREAEEWLNGLRLMLVQVRCGGACRKVVLAAVLAATPAPEDPDNLVVLSPYGPIVQGTRRHPNADWIIGIAKGTHRRVQASCPCLPGRCVVPEHQLTGQPPSKSHKVRASGVWIALLDRVSVKTLPVWCDRHGERFVSVAELKRRCAAVVATDKRRPDWMETIPHSSTKAL